MVKNSSISFALHNSVKLLGSDRVVDVAIGESMDESLIGQVDSTKICFRFEVGKIIKWFCLVENIKTINVLTSFLNSGRL